MTNEITQRVLEIMKLAVTFNDGETRQELTDEQLTTLTWYRTMMYDWKNRAD